MDDFFKNDEFSQFIINEYLTGSGLTDEEKLEKVGSSIEEFVTALDCFKLSGGVINKH